MTKIIIYEEITDVDCLTNLMEIIKTQIIKGYTSGYYPTWKLDMTYEERVVLRKSVEETWEE